MKRKKYKEEKREAIQEHEQNITEDKNKKAVQKHISSQVEVRFSPQQHNRIERRESLEKGSRAP
jgi:hypothetical protein